MASRWPTPTRRASTRSSSRTSRAASEQVKHPVHDFLFTYYSQRPAQLRRWHPGFGVALEDAAGARRAEGLRAASVDEVAQRPREPVTVAADHVASQRPLLTQLHALLTATAGRAPQFGCFGLHEWAMVHRASEDGTRHDWPLRLGQDGHRRGRRVAPDRLLALRRLPLLHPDGARPLNTLQPGRDDRPAFEQPGCLHAGMDLYKHAFRLTPMIPSDLVADCFELARDIRVLDMRAAPYDLADLGFEPVRIETAGGQGGVRRGAARRSPSAGAPLRARLVAECERLLAGRTRASSRPVAHQRRRVEQSTSDARSPAPRRPSRRDPALGRWW